MVAAASLQQTHGLLWVIMVTSAENRGWHEDVAIPDHAKVGLPVPSIIRPAKIATIEAAHAALLGRVSPATLRAVRQRLSAIFEIARESA